MISVRKLFHVIFFATILFAPNECRTQSAIRDSTSSLPSFFNRKNVVTYGIIGFSAATIFVEYNWWWKGDYHSFVFQPQGWYGDHSLGVDKTGHFYTSYFIFGFIHDALKWAGADEKTNTLLSIAIPVFHAVSVEIGDGYSSYRFDPNDLTTNLAGVAYGYAQTQIPVLKNFNFKFSYYPSGLVPFDKNWDLAGDYDGHIYWLSCNVHDVLPQTWQQYWPRFLTLAAGYGANNISRGTSGETFRKFAIGFDYNINELPLTGDTWDMVKNIFDKFHFPAPGIRFIEQHPAEVKPLLLN